MFTKLKKFFKLINFSALEQEYEEALRERFEQKAFASGQFKGVRFTRSKEGNYLDARLEAAWQECIEFDDWAARQR